MNFRFFREHAGVHARQMVMTVASPMRDATPARLAEDTLTLPRTLLLQGSTGLARGNGWISAASRLGYGNLNPKWIYRFGGYPALGGPTLRLIVRGSMEPPNPPPSGGGAVVHAELCRTYHPLQHAQPCWT